MYPEFCWCYDNKTACRWLWLQQNRANERAHFLIHITYWHKLHAYECTLPPNMNFIKFSVMFSSSWKCAAHLWAKKIESSLLVLLKSHHCSLSALRCSSEMKRNYIPIYLPCHSLAPLHFRQKSFKHFIHQLSCVVFVICRKKQSTSNDVSLMGKHGDSINSKCPLCTLLSCSSFKSFSSFYHSIRIVIRINV